MYIYIYDIFIYIHVFLLSLFVPAKELPACHAGGGPHGYSDLADQKRGCGVVVFGRGGIDGHSACTSSFHPKQLEIWKMICQTLQQQRRTNHKTISRIWKNIKYCCVAKSPSTFQRFWSSPYKFQEFPIYILSTIPQLPHTSGVMLKHWTLISYIGPY